MSRTPWTKERVIQTIRECHGRGVPVARLWKECWPACLASYSLFGSWRDALAAAGLESPRQRWSRERVIRELQTRHRDGGNLRKDNPILVAATQRYFGSWRRGLRAAGLPVPRERSPHRSWTANAVLVAIRERHERGLPLAGVGREDPSLYAVARRLFGGWQHAVCAAGLAPPPPEPLTAEQILQTIRTWRLRGLSLKRLPGQEPRVYRAARRVFGSWQRALQAAGVDPEIRRRWDRDRVIDAMRQRLQRGLPLSRVWREDKPLFRAAVTHFGNWQNALHAAGLAFKPRRKWSKEQILQELRGKYLEGVGNVRRVDPALAGAAVCYFGSLEAAWEAAGLDPPAGRWTRRRIVEAIQDGYVRGLPLACAGFKDRKLAAAAKRHFGSWREAVDAAGLLPRLPPPIVQRVWSPQAVLDAIRAHNPCVGAVWKVDSGLYSAAKKHFGSWSAAIQAATRGQSLRV